ncbi:MAG: hypothetical protein AAFU61_17365, partial [Pseudomonadota bacterium]
MLLVSTAAHEGSTSSGGGGGGGGGDSMAEERLEELWEELGTLRRLAEAAGLEAGDPLAAAEQAAARRSAVLETDLALARLVLAGPCPKGHTPFS